MVLSYNLWQSPKLKKKSTATRHQVLVSILIPARNEEKNIAQTLHYLLEQDYKQLEILVLDDFSTDKTAEIVNSFSQKNPNIKCLQGKPLPADWLGKNWACHQLSQVAKGDYLLFVDADVLLQKHCIAAAVAAFEKQKLSLLSIFPDQLLNSKGEQIVVPLMHELLLTLLPLRLVFLRPEASLAAANGQFMLFKRENYLKHQYHKQLKNAIVEDIEIARLIKKKREKVATYLANGLVECQMYGSWAEAVAGFSKNLLAGFNNSVFALLLFCFLLSGGYLFLAWKSPILFSVCLGLILFKNYALARLGNFSVGQLLLWQPVRILALLWIAFLSIFKKLRKKNEWKGRKI